MTLRCPQCGNDVPSLLLHKCKHDRKRSDVITRGDVLDALDRAIQRYAGSPHYDDILDPLRELREAFK
jgi:hypothetical protein